MIGMMSLDTKLNRHAVKENDREEERVSLRVCVGESTAQ